MSEKLSFEIAKRKLAPVADAVFDQAHQRRGSEQISASDGRDGVADLDDPALKGHIASLKAIRDQAQAGAAWAAAMLESSAQQAITSQMVQGFARTARERIRIDSGGYGRDHLGALAQHVEVADREVRIIGSKSNLLQTLIAVAGIKLAAAGVRSSV